MEQEKQTCNDKYVREQYENAIKYYWNASKANKRWYKTTRMMTVILGALVTLIASLASSEIFKSNQFLIDLFRLLTPILAFLLTVIAGFSQSFQWGRTWQNMIITAQNLQKEYDMYVVSPDEKKDYEKEVEKLNSFVINESKNFFERVLGSVKTGN